MISSLLTHPDSTQRAFGRCIGILLFPFALATVSFATAVDAAATLPLVSPVFGDHMVLQRGKTNTIWGWAEPGESVKVELASHHYATTAGTDGRWLVHFQPLLTGGPYTLQISGPRKIEIHDILVGDVWLCGGQSNMELPLSRVRNGADEIKSADHPNIRFFRVKQQCAYTPASIAEGAWKVCSPATVAEGAGFSAVAYFFARKIQSKTNVPIGLIEDCVGGTPAEAWTSPETLRQFSDFEPALNAMDHLRALGGPVYGNYVMPWYDEFDVGLKGTNWNAPELDDHDWQTVIIPGGFKELGVPDAPAVCYFRKTIVLPDPLPAGKAAIHLGVIERMDTTEINGQWVGASAWVENPRIYSVAPGVLKPGTNLLTVRVMKTRPKGGFESAAGDLKLVLGDQTEIPLDGEWKGRVSVDARPPHPLPLSFENWPVMPAVLYEGMITPVAPFAISGAIWYQGEANAGRATQYRKVLPAMIADWRKAFGQGDFPFYIVSLPAFMKRHSSPPDGDSWAELRDAQAFVARTVTNSALAVTIDTGEASNIHPQDKKEVGERLALIALARQYGKKVTYMGPTFDHAETLPGALKLFFKNTAGGLVVKGEEPSEFALAGSNHKWTWANAKLDGKTIVVSSPDVAEPKFVRYAWQSNPLATLFNGAGLPAVPFRTDDQ